MSKDLSTSNNNARSIDGYIDDIVQGYSQPSTSYRSTSYGNIR